MNYNQFLLEKVLISSIKANEFCQSIAKDTDNLEKCRKLLAL